MKKYTKPVAEIVIFESTDIITLSGNGTQENIGGMTAEALGISLNS
ncbi:MAG: hypothetical protein IJ583_10825 [Firmicutes bacterium]|nr:hypothetical protein [Bacillota bacterium]